MPKTSCHVALFRNNKQEILLTLRRDYPVWVMPGGRKNKDETNEETAVREVFEETGLRIK